VKNEIILFTDGDMQLEVPITPEQDTVWLTQEQMSVLFDTARSAIAYHINNLFREEELDKDTSVEIFDRSINKASRPPQYYNLDVIISVGYRVKSKRGVAFRKWANQILKEHILKGYTTNDKRLEQLNVAIKIMKHSQNLLDTQQVISVIEQYNTALTILDDYDHQRIEKPAGSKASYVLNYEECRDIINKMSFSANSDLFGNEKDDSFKGSIANIYQTFAREELYPTLEEKAANLLYLITKNHSFSDGNKRIAATMFLYFLDKNEVLIKDGEKLFDDYTLVALTIMIAESRPEEKEIMIDIIMKCLGRNI
jgi:death-on-curing family protein